MFTRTMRMKRVLYFLATISAILWSTAIFAVEQQGTPVAMIQTVYNGQQATPGVYSDEYLQRVKYPLDCSWWQKLFGLCKVSFEACPKIADNEDQCIDCCADASVTCLGDSEIACTNSERIFRARCLTKCQAVHQPGKRPSAPSSLGVM